LSKKKTSLKGIRRWFSGAPPGSRGLGGRRGNLGKLEGTEGLQKLSQEELMASHSLAERQPMVGHNHKKWTPTISVETLPVKPGITSLLHNTQWIQRDQLIHC